MTPDKIFIIWIDFLSSYQGGFSEISNQIIGPVPEIVRVFNSSLKLTPVPHEPEIDFINFFLF